MGFIRFEVTFLEYEEAMKLKRNPYIPHPQLQFAFISWTVTFGGCMEMTLVKSFCISGSSDRLFALSPSVSLLNARGWKMK